MPAKSRRLATREAKISFDRHARKCQICRHSRRDEIEEAFIDWVSPHSIYIRYNLRNEQSVYRHAHAAGLFEPRRLNVRIALERLIERAGSVSPTPDSIIRSVHALSRIDGKGRWIEPVRRVVVAKRAILAQQSQASPKEITSRRAITYQGEITSQEMMPLHVRGPKSQGARDREGREPRNHDRDHAEKASGQQSLAEEFKALRAHVAELARRDDESPAQAAPTQTTTTVSPTQRASWSAPAGPPQVFGQPTLLSLLERTEQAFDAIYGPKSLIDSDEQLENAVTDEEQTEDDDSNR